MARTTRSRALLTLWTVLETSKLHSASSTLSFIVPIARCWFEEELGHVQHLSLREGGLGSPSFRPTIQVLRYAY